MTTSKRLFEKLDSFNSNARMQFWTALFIAVITGLASQVYFYEKELVFAYADAVSHLNISRRFFDSLTPGLLSQMGIVWLPIPHLILISFVHFDYLWFTGIAGSIVGFYAYVVTSIYIFKIGEIIVPQSKIVKWLAFFVFAFNPNILYLQTTAMTESIFYLFVFGALIYFLRWLNSNMRIHLIAAGFYCAVAMGTRYEGWMMTIFAGVLAMIIYHKIGRSVYRGSFLFFSFPGFFVFLWLLYNLFYYGDPLAFQRGEYSSEILMEKFANIGNMPGKGNLWVSIVIFFRSIYASISPVLVWISFAGIAVYAYKNRWDKEKIMPYYTIFGIVMGILSLFLGQVAITLNDEYTKGYFNARYGLIMLPFVLYFICYIYTVIRNQPVIKYGFVALVMINSLLWVFDFPNSAGSVTEAIYLFNYRPELKRASAYLEMNYDGKRILFDDKNIVIYPYSKIPMKDRINKYTFEYGETALAKPSKVVGWIIIDKKVSDEIYEKIKDNVDFRLNFILTFIDGGVEIYRRR